MSVTAAYQIPRNSLAWLLFSVAAVIAPHVGRLPIWVTLICVGCAFWRIMVYRGRWSYPPRWVKVVFVVLGFATVPLSYSKFTGLEPAIALLIIAFVLKLLEMQQKRDAYVAILLAYFVVIAEFLFEQSIPYTLYMCAVVVVITTALVGLHQTQSHHQPLKTLKTAGTLLAQSLPLMLVLFVLFPRIPPLWTVPLQSDAGKTGVSDTMSPGDIASLTQSDQLAFKATFKSTPPTFSRLYWRGLVLSEFDGKTWRQDPMLRRSVWRARTKAPDWIKNIEYQGDVVDYDIILEPTQQNWLFSLDMPELPSDRGLVVLHDYRLVTTTAIRQRLRYSLSSHLDHRLQRVLSDFWRYRYTLLPGESNSLSRSFAERLRGEHDSDQAYIRAVLRRYNLQEFVYTLKPPKLGADGIDEFLFRTKRGFCEHYAGSFVFLMRAAGIPARVVVGYQGGEYNPNGNYVSVRQFDAHAWTEIWLPERGWVRVDPTSAVAPERIERGLEAAVSDENSFLENSPLSIFRYRQLLWLTDLRMQMDAIGHYWDTWVVGYTPESQMSLLRRYLGDVDRKQLGMMMLSVFFTALGLIGLFVLASRSSLKLPRQELAYLKFCNTMAKLGCERTKGEGAYDYGVRLRLQYPGLSDEIDAVTEYFVTISYDPAAQTSRAEQKRRLVRLQKAVVSLRFKALRFV